MKRKFPVVWADALIFNGAWSYDPKDEWSNYSLEQVQFTEWYKQFSGRVEQTESPIDYMLGAGIGKALVNGGRKLAVRAAVKAGSRKVAAKTSGTSLGAARSSVKGYLKNVGNVPRNQLVKDLEGAGFKKVFDGKGMQHFQRGNWKVRLDPVHGGTNYPHMHINYGGNKNAFDIFLNPVNYKSSGAHIPILAP